MKIQKRPITHIPKGSLIYRSKHPWGYLENVYRPDIYGGPEPQDVFAIRDYYEPSKVQDFRQPYGEDYEYMIPTDFSQIEFLHEEKVRKPKDIKVLILGTQVSAKRGTDLLLCKDIVPSMIIGLTLKGNTRYYEVLLKSPYISIFKPLHFRVMDLETGHIGEFPMYPFYEFDMYVKKGKTYTFPLSLSGDMVTIKV